MKFKSFAEALSADRPIPLAANDNKRQRPPVYRGGLPALRWLFDNHPDLAPAMARAIPRPVANWFAEVEPSRQEIRPTVGELMMASHDANGKPYDRIINSDETGERIRIGDLKFVNGKLTEWGGTRKGRRLKPKDAARVGEDKSGGARNNRIYLNTRPTTPSPMHADPLPRNMSDHSAISSMYDPLPGVEAARNLLRSMGVDGSVSADDLPVSVTHFPDAPAAGAVFLGGISRGSGGSSSGAIMWENPESPSGEAASVIEEVAARGNLKSIGIKLGHGEDAAIAAGKAALIEAARILTAANDNKKTQDIDFRDAV